MDEIKEDMIEEEIALIKKIINGKSQSNAFIRSQLWKLGYVRVDLGSGSSASIGSLEIRIMNIKNLLAFIQKKAD